MDIEGGRMSGVYDFNGIKLWFADGCPSTREEAEGYLKHAQTKNLDLTEMIVVRDGDWADIKYTVRARPFERIRRITGYLVGTTDRFNNAKQAEEHDRVKHDLADRIDGELAGREAGVECTGCGISTYGHQQKDEAKAAWNRAMGGRP